jgi:hypothetical protein
VDWPIAASNAFLWFAAIALMAAPIAGAAGGWRAMPRTITTTLAVAFLLSFALLAFGWRGIPGGIRAAVSGHAALLIAIAALTSIGRVARAMFADRLVAAMAGLGAGVLLVAGIFALAPLTRDVSAAHGRWLLLSNPLVAVTSAAGIDLLHLDTFYRTSPLAHRGVAVPAWTTACLVYAAVGFAASGVSRLRPWSPRP